MMEREQFTPYSMGQPAVAPIAPRPPPPPQATVIYTDIPPGTEIVEGEIECTPYMCTNRIQLLRWFQLAALFTLQWLVQIVCGNDACTMIMNVFGYIALGQAFVLIIFLWMAVLLVPIMCLYAMNGHRWIPGVMNGLEKVYAFSGIALFPIAGILGAWMAALTVNEEYNYQGRGYAHIRPQWIAAAVIEFLMVPIYVIDLLWQRREHFPFSVKDYSKVTQRPADSINPNPPRYDYDPNRYNDYL
ncbi:unnamed protein product, partial [Mesorhabditis spiculigera]